MSSEFVIKHLGYYPDISAEFRERFEKAFEKAINDARAEGYDDGFDNGYDDGCMTADEVAEKDGWG